MIEHRSDSQRILQLLQKWGWETGLKRLEAELAAIEDPHELHVARQFVGWMAAERGNYSQAEAALGLVTDSPTVGGWAWLGLAFIAMRSRNTSQAQERLTKAEECTNCDPSLLGNIRLVQGTTMFHLGETEASLQMLEEAATLLSPECFTYGRVLDALGMYYAHQGNLHAAVAFFERALQHKEEFRDDAGRAVTHGQLGRFYLDWGRYDLAEKHCRADLEICRRIDDFLGECKMYNALGQISLARNDIPSAVAYLEHSVQRAKDGSWAVTEGYALKDLALCRLVRKEWASAREHLDAARQLFEGVNFAEGLAHVDRVQGMLNLEHGEWSAAERSLKRALQFFEQTHEQSEVARTRLNLARLLYARQAPLPLVRDEFLCAIEEAELSRRPQLVQLADAELSTIAPDAAARHIYRRVRGRRITEDSTSLTSAEQDIVTIFFFDLQGFTAWSANTDPSLVMLCLNQMMATLLQPTVRHDVQVIEYMGDGFLALAQGPNHARRAVQCAIDLYAALQEFNRPRRTLQLPDFTCRIGLSTGEVVLGNVGTYEKIDYRAIGSTVNLAARIQNEALPGRPCVSRATWEVTRNEFEFAGPRQVTLKGLGEVAVWDTVGLKKSSAS